MWQLSARSKLQASPVQVATCHAGYSQRASAPAWAARYGCRRQLTLVSTFATGSPPTAWMLAPGRCPSYFRGEITTAKRQVVPLVPPTGALCPSRGGAW
ncbi:hypothetical protein CHLRE_12g523320v5 [Chlamydomonas reinhardtii]|uniref:Uncharacterized protein n=1 Tax=Chlamydomonas reinhardtii TaxID=3055 RepID=A0A2K3D487_CHLRE|nr:uncharacterized protein CHLRE_12g523320v5 [Chlamydomonas reinhardtii]XP_042918506.1 uncharacterized protein CHLRE_12g523320v5 [Chlamydomonas reinhardtii]PNW75345.1 hypothetical protein CHLRE_12g523320v5 [Chlamydomonas reinhardtii]PNW75346.1 hypothetical protein CHLRE_12g523320v5 [Chlamydomonas reinhardtii]